MRRHAARSLAILALFASLLAVWAGARSAVPNEAGSALSITAHVTDVAEVCLARQQLAQPQSADGALAPLTTQLSPSAVDAPRPQALPSRRDAQHDTDKSREVDEDDRDDDSDERGAQHAPAAAAYLQYCTLATLGVPPRWRSSELSEASTARSAAPARAPPGA